MDMPVFPQKTRKKIDSSMHCTLSVFPREMFTSTGALVRILTGPSIESCYKK